MYSAVKIKAQIKQTTDTLGCPLCFYFNIAEAISIDEISGA